MSSITDQRKRASLAPVLSNDNTLLAVITADATLLITNLADNCMVHEIQLPRSVNTIVERISILQWAPEIVHMHDERLKASQPQLRAWILLTSISRLIGLEVVLPASKTMNEVQPPSAHILYDCEFEPQYGKIILAEFVFSYSYALLTFEMNTHASLISFENLEREDIMSPKFTDHAGFAQHAQRQHFALLLRVKGQDQVAIFSTKSGMADNAAMFLPGTADAQRVKWAPNDDPVLAVWESAVYGPKILFFTALGHVLKQLHVEPLSLASEFSSLENSALGVTCLGWAKSRGKGTLLVFGVGNQHLIVQQQDEKSMIISKRMIYHYQSVIDGTQIAVFRQRDCKMFDSESAVIGLQYQASSETDTIEFNANASMIATKINGLPNVIWIWDLNYNCISTIVIFRCDVRRLAWHPRVADALVIVTSEKTPCVYLCNGPKMTPRCIALPLENQTAAGKLTARWIQLPQMTSCPLLVSYKKQYDLCLLKPLDDGHIMCESMLDEPDISKASDDESSEIDTPSRSIRSSVLNFGTSHPKMYSCDGIRNNDSW